MLDESNFFFNCIDVIILQYDSKHKRRTYEFAKEEKIIVLLIRNYTAWKS